MLEAKTLTIKKSNNSSGKVVNFIPEIIEDKEVYSVVNKTIFSFGPMMDHAQKGYDENKSGEAFCSLKNTVVKLNETDFFHNNTSGPLHLINSVVEGTTTIKTSRMKVVIL